MSLNSYSVFGWQLQIPVLSLDKILGQSVFPKNSNFLDNMWKIQSSMYLSQSIIKDITRASLKGIEFVTIAIAL